MSKKPASPKPFRPALTPARPRRDLASGDGQDDGVGRERDDPLDELAHRRQVSSTTAGAKAGRVAQSARASSRRVARQVEVRGARGSRENHIEARMGRPLSGCNGLALFGYSILNAESWAWETVDLCWSTSQRTPSLHGGVVSEPSNS